MFREGESLGETLVRPKSAAADRPTVANFSTIRSFDAGGSLLVGGAARRGAGHNPSPFQPPFGSQRLAPPEEICFNGQLGKRWDGTMRHGEGVPSFH